MKLNEIENYKNYDYIIEEVDRCSNEEQKRYRLFSSKANIKKFDDSPEELEKLFKGKIDAIIDFAEDLIQPLSDSELLSFKDKIRKNKTNLKRIIDRELYLSEKNSCLTVSEIFHHSNIINEIFNDCSVILKLERTDNFCGGYHYILINERHKYSPSEQTKICDKLNQ